MDTQKAQIVERLKQANNILVTVSANPTVDQLSAAIGTTVLLNKLGKHATAVFSGEVPSVLEFLEPAKTIETNTNSLRDFIISLDKNKADKLRYKVEDDHVRIFITPYRTSISDKDLVFSQGDFNVEVVLALGILKQQDLDQAIAAHGRILHDATVIDVSMAQVTGLGTMNLINPKASSLCEMMVDIGTELKPDVLDMQMATAFLTGIVAQTNRFSNDKTTAQTMEASSKLLAAGANQQLVADKLQPPKPATPPPAPKSQTAAPATPAEPATLPKPEPNQVASDGSLQIDHGPPLVDLNDYEISEDEPEEEGLEQIHIDDQGQLKAVDPKQQVAVPPTDNPDPGGRKVLEPLSSTQDTAEAPSSSTGLEPPTTGGTLTASGTDQPEQPVNPLADSAPGSVATQPLLSHDAQSNAGAQQDQAGPTPAEPVQQVPNTLADIERSVDSPHTQEDATPAAMNTAGAPPVGVAPVDEARDAVQNVTGSPSEQPLPPIEALGAQYMDLPGTGGDPAQAAVQPNPVPVEMPPAATVAPVAEQPQVTATDPTAPPPVPPPMMPSSFTPTPPSS